jgi:hypothetical protein
VTTNEQELFAHYLAKKVKELYRESLVFQAVSKYLRDNGVPAFDEIVEDCRKSLEIAAAVALFDGVIDSKIPPFSEESQDQALVELIQRCGLDQGKPN